MKILKLLAVVFFLATFSVNAYAGRYIVYKANYIMARFVKRGSSGEWSYDKREDQLKFEGYVIVDLTYKDSEREDPVKIITFRSDRKLFPAKYDASSGLWVVDTSKRATNKFFVHPYSTTWPDGSKTTSILENYSGTEADDFYVFAGVWDTCEIKNSVAEGNIYCMLDYYGDDTEENEGGADEHEMDKVKGYGENYSGLVKQDGYAPVMGGTLSIQRENTIAKSKRIILREAKGLSRRAAMKATMAEAVDEVVDYLTRKKYVSTWAE